MKWSLGTLAAYFFATTTCLWVLSFPDQSLAAPGLLIQGYAEEKHDRFYQPGVGEPIKDFVGSAYDWSGVARGATGSTSSAPGEPNGWLTMISESYFISAEHFHPSSGATVKFYRTNDAGTSETWTGTIQSSNIQVGSSDLWMNQILDASTETMPPPSWVKRYPVMKRQDGTYWPSYVAPTVFIAGSASGIQSATSMRIGRNEIDEIQSPTNLHYLWSYDTQPGEGLGDDEAATRNQDSGGPSFFVSPSGLSLAGIHHGGSSDTSPSGFLAAIQSALPSQETIQITTDLVGDINADYHVDTLDLDIFGTNYGMPSGAQYNQGDLNGDGSIDLLDLDILSAAFGNSLYAPSDFNQDKLVDLIDLQEIANHWKTNVASGTNGDATEDGYVDVTDAAAFDTNILVASTYTAPTIHVEGDGTNDGLVNILDLNELGLYFGQTLDPEDDPFSHGDANGDGIVDILDLDLISAHFGESFADVDSDGVVGPLDFEVLADNFGNVVLYGKNDGDLNLDGVVDQDDLEAMYDWWGTVPPYGPGNPVPEPSTLALVALAALSSVRRRR